MHPMSHKPGKKGAKPSVATSTSSVATGMSSIATGTSSVATGTSSTPAASKAMTFIAKTSGIIGATGAISTVGATGATSTVGATGATSTVGATGATSTVGATGVTSTIGATGAISTVGATGATIASLTNTTNFAQHALEHIFEGEKNKHGNVVGYHHESMASAKASLVAGQTLNVDVNGLYQGKVEIGTTQKSAMSTFFPKSMTAQEVVDIINEAYANKNPVGPINPNKNNLYTGQGTIIKTASKITINMYLDPSGKIVTAFPKK